MTISLLSGCCLSLLATLPDESIHTCVTSPPYFGLRDYGVEGQIGLEPTPDAFVAVMVQVFREVRRVLRDDGTLWLNLGDSYATRGGANQTPHTGEIFQRRERGKNVVCRSKRLPRGEGRWGGVNALAEGTVKPKDLLGIPWRVAFALQADGWYLRQDIIWSKPNPMPESVRDRCTKSHEYLFLLSKSERYHFDADAIAEPVTASTIERLSQPTLGQQRGSDRVPGKTNGTMKAVAKRSGNKERKLGAERGCPERTGANVCGSVPWEGTTRNKRTVWTVATQPFKDAHFATFPPDLIEPCVLAGCPEGGTVLDPFFGAGTTGLVSDRHGRHCIGIELNPEYVQLAEQRLRSDAGMFADIVVAS
jgi:DNA modification methylase